MTFNGVHLMTFLGWDQLTLSVIHCHTVFCWNFVTFSQRNTFALSSKPFVSILSVIARLNIFIFTFYFFTRITFCSLETRQVSGMINTNVLQFTLNLLHTRFCTVLHFLMGTSVHLWSDMVSHFVVVLGSQFCFGITQHLSSYFTSHFLLYEVLQSSTSTTCIIYGIKLTNWHHFHYNMFTRVQIQQPHDISDVGESIFQD